MPRIVPAASPESFTSFGDLLKYLRRRAHLTQKDLSIAVGYSEPQISYLETNRRLPDVATVAARFVPELDLADAPELARRLIDLAEVARHEADPAPGDPPFKGLQYFDESDTDLFFGREELTAQLVARLNLTSVTQANTNLRFLAIVGASGSGKSSIVRAGLVPALRQHPNANWRLQVITPTAHPLQVLVAHQAATVLVVDQFEELFTLCSDEAERTAYIDQLLDGTRAGVVIALRADFYSECAHYANLREALAQHQAYIGPMNAIELRRVIEEPAKCGSWEFEPGLIDLLLRDTSEEPAALPLLSHALLETWTRRRGRTLTVSGYLASGGVQGAIAETAETVFNDELDPAQRAIARNIFLRLTELGEGTQTARRRADLSELILRAGDELLVESVINHLADAPRIITSESTVEIAHEALIREWPTLHQWLIEDRESLLLHRQLAIAAQAWDSNGRPPDELYRGARLARALEWAAIHSDESNVLERAFLDAAREQAEHEQFERERQIQRELEAAQKLAETESRSAKQLRRRAIFLAGAFVLAIILAGAAIVFNWEATLNAQTAQQEQQIAVERELAASAINNLSIDPERSILLSLQAVNISLQNKQPVLLEAQDALHRSVQASRAQATLKGHAGGIWTVAVNRAGTQLATISQDGTAKVWDTATNQVVLTLPTKVTDNLNGTGVVFSADEQHLLTVSADHTATVWDIATGQVHFTLTGHIATVTAVAVSPDGKLFATSSNDRTVKLWDAATGKEVRTLTGHDSGVLGVAFSPDGNRLYTASRDGTIKVWDVSLAAGSDWLNLAGHTSRVWSVAYRPDGKQIATLSFDGSLKVWDAGSGQNLLTLALPGVASTGAVGGVSYSPDGKRLAFNYAFTTTVIDATNGAEILRLPPFKDGMMDLAFSHDGTQLAVGSEDGTLGIYDSGSGKLIVRFLTSSAGLQRITFSPDGKRIASATGDGAYVWDAVTGQKLLAFSGHGDGVHTNGIAFSPDGKWIATSGNDATIKVWDSKTGAEIFTLSGHTGATFSTAFSADGQYLATSSVDRTVKIWKLPKLGEQVPEPLTLYGNTGSVYQVAFSPDGTRIVSVGRDPIVRLYALNINDLIGVAKSRLTRTLTQSECVKYLHVDQCLAMP